MKYDYAEAVKKDVIDYINSHYDYDYGLGEDFDSLDDFRDELRERCFENDDVTGNGSGSYTFNRENAEECLSHNWDLLAEMAKEYNEGFITSDELDDPETLDVKIRCYVLDSAIEDALDKLGIDYTTFEKHDEDEYDEDEYDEEEYDEYDEDDERYGEIVVGESCINCSSRYDCAAYKKVAEKAFLNHIKK